MFKWPNVSGLCRVYPYHSPWKNRRHCHLSIALWRPLSLRECILDLKPEIVTHNFSMVQQVKLYILSGWKFIGLFLVEFGSFQILIAWKFDSNVLPDVCVCRLFCFNVLTKYFPMFWCSSIYPTLWQNPWRKPKNSRHRWAKDVEVKRSVHFSWAHITS